MENNNDYNPDDRKSNNSSDQPKAKADSENKPQNRSEDDDLDFVVTETGAEQREFVGGTQQFTPKDEQLDIESVPETDDRSSDQQPPRHRPSTDYSEPIGMSEPPPPPGAAESSAYPPGPDSGPGQTNQPQDHNATGRDLPKLTEAQIRSIREKMYGQSNGLSEKDKKEILESADKQQRPLFKNEPIVPPKKKAGDIPKPAGMQSDEPAPAAIPVAPPVAKSKPTRPESKLPRPQMAPSERGVAFFYRNYVQLAGRNELKAGDFLTMGDREYELRPKQISPKVLYTASAIVGLILLIFIGAFFVSDPTGEGQLMGIVLDAEGQPYIQKASIRFPELGRTIESNAQGFFLLGHVAEGSYKIQYIINDEVIGEDYATVVNGQPTLVALRPGTSASGDDGIASNDQSEPVKNTPSQNEINRTVAASTPVQEPEPEKKETPKTTAPVKKSGPGKVKLLANIDGARFQLDGRTLGAGNITFTQIQSGRRKYEVSADGYEPESGYVNVQPGETATLKVVLRPLSMEQKVENFSANDFYLSGINSLKENRNETAITDFTHAVDKDPGYGDAYNGRAEAYYNLGEMTSAHNDFVRAAEIYTVRKQYGSAITAYNRALTIDPQSLTAYLGRGNLYLLQGQDIAAITDFDVAHDIDDENPQVYIGLGKARFNQQNYKKAIDYFKKARKYDEKNPLPYQYLMLSYLAVDKLKDVQKSYDQYKEIASENELARLKNDKSYAAVMAVVEDK